MKEEQEVIQIKILIQKNTFELLLKENELSYIKEFDRLKKENDLQGHIRSNSIIMCEMLFTSDKEFFDEIGEKETKDILKKVIILYVVTKILKKKI